MPQTRTALRAMRKSKKRKLSNLRVAKDLKNAIKNFKKLLDNKNIEEAQKILPSIYKKLDMASSKNIIHKNTAARQKSRLSKALNKIKPSGKA